MRYVNIFLAFVLLFSFICPAFGSSADWYMVQEAYEIANGRDWFIADMEDYGRCLIIGITNYVDRYDFYYRPWGSEGQRYIKYCSSDGGCKSTVEYFWDGSSWNEINIDSGYFNFEVYNHRILYSNEDIRYYPETYQVFFSRTLPRKPLDLGEIMEESPVLPTMMTVGGVVSGEALKIFGILLVILLVVYLVRSWARFRV